MSDQLVEITRLTGLAGLALGVFLTLALLVPKIRDSGTARLFLIVAAVVALAGLGTSALGSRPRIVFNRCAVVSSGPVEFSGRVYGLLRDSTLSIRNRFDPNY